MFAYILRYPIGIAGCALWQDIDKRCMHPKTSPKEQENHPMAVRSARRKDFLHGGAAHKRMADA